MSAFLNYLREEWRLIRLHTWATEYATPEPCSHADPRVQRTLARLAQTREEMRRHKRGLLDGREVPEQFLATTDVRATCNAARNRL